ncbi:MAG: hypothetical protein ACJ8AI_12140 [Rhodopila sp.]
MTGASDTGSLVIGITLWLGTAFRAKAAAFSEVAEEVRRDLRSLEGVVDAGDENALVRPGGGGLV